MESLNFDTVFDDILGDYSLNDLDQASTNVSPVENEDIYVNLDLPNPDMSSDNFLLEDVENLDLIRNFESSEYTKSDICSFCFKNLVKSDEEIPKKRKRIDENPECASTKVCRECKSLDIKDLSKYKNASVGSKMAIKREKVKQALAQKKSEELVKLEEEEQQVIEASKNLPIEEQRRLRQKMRNRVSAQRSRDKKKELMSDILIENENLKQRNTELKKRLEEAESENAHLKRQLSNDYLVASGDSRVSKGIKYSTMGFIAALSVMMIVSSSQTQIQSTELAIPLRKLAELPAVKSNELSVIYKSTQDFDASYQYDIGEYRQNRIDMHQDVPSFRAYPGANDPCTKNMVKKLGDGDFTTLFCPSIQAYWDESLESPNLQVVQIVTPLESIPGLAPAFPVDSSQNYMLEIICKVSDINVLPVAQTVLDS